VPFQNKNKFDTLEHLVGFTIEMSIYADCLLASNRQYLFDIYYDAWLYERQIRGYQYASSGTRTRNPKSSISLERLAAH